MTDTITLDLDEAKTVAWALYWSHGEGQHYDPALARRLHEWISSRDPAWDIDTRGEHKAPYVHDEVDLPDLQWPTAEQLIARAAEVIPTAGVAIAEITPGGYYIAHPGGDSDRAGDHTPGV